MATFERAASDPGGDPRVSGNPDPPAIGGRCRVGDRVLIRRQRWRVSGIADEAGGRTLTLDGLGPQNVHERRQLLEPFERIEPLDLASGGDDRVRCWRTGRRRWRHAWSEVLAGAGPWNALHAADDAQIAVLPHQLDPALAIVSGEATRVLLADAVGLGKTVQAGLIAAELLRRGAATSALVLCPAGLRDQWQCELAARFSLPAAIVDLRAAIQLAMELPVGVNPWTTLPIAIASIDYVKRPEILPSARARCWDLVIVDEAHLVAPGSDRLAALSQLCSLALFVVLLTATPHSGDRQAYAALRTLGSHDEVCLQFRRTRAAVHLATARRSHRLRVRQSTAEARMHAALDRYAAALRGEHGDDSHAGLLLTVLRKRALSSAASLARSIARRLTVVGAAADGVERQQLRLPLDDGAGELDACDEAPLLDGPALHDAGRERQLLQRIGQLADTAAARESKLRALARLLRRLACRGEAALVFTEYRDTALHLQQTLLPGALVLHGGLARHDRNAVIDRFTQGAAPVLIATDAAGEGLNLHHRCRCVVHLEVPWNPVRLEQRTGRVDRIGQRRTVHAFHLVARHPAEDHLLQRLARRTAIACEDTAAGAAADGEAAGAADRSDSAAVTAVRVAGSGEAARLAQQRRRRCIGWRNRRPTGRPRGRRTPAVAAHARGTMRVYLRNRSLLLIERLLRDEAHRPVAAMVEGYWLAPQPPPAARRDRPLASGARTVVDALPPPAAATIAWCTAEAEIRAGFWRSAVARAARIAAALRPHGSPLFQPGLFDRRGDRLRRARLDEQQELEDACCERVARLKAVGAAVDLTAGHVLLLEG